MPVAWRDMSDESKERQKAWLRSDRKKNPEKYRRYAADHRKAVKEHPERYVDGDPDYHKKRYANEKDKRKAAAALSYRIRQRERGEWLRETAHFLGCFICGEEQTHRLAWHHLTPLRDNDPRTRVSSIAVSKGIEAAREEMKRCIVLCANCHLDVHHWDRL